MLKVYKERLGELINCYSNLEAKYYAAITLPESIRTEYENLLIESVQEGKIILNKDIKNE